MILNKEIISINPSEDNAACEVSFDNKIFFLIVKEEGYFDS